MVWINKTVQKQVQRRTADLRSEFLLRSDALKEEMMAELRELVLNETRERALQYREIIQEHTRRDEEEEKQHLDPRTVSVCSSKNSTAIYHKQLVGMFKVLLAILSDVKTSGAPSDADNIKHLTKCDTCKVIKNVLDVFSGLQSYNLWDDETSSDSENSSPMVKTEQEENQANSLDDFIFSKTSQLILDSEEEGSSVNPTQANSSFITQEPRCESEKVQVDTTKVEEALVMERQWKEWMDKQEMGGNKAKVVQPVVQREAETQGGEAHRAPHRPPRQHTEGGHNLMKMMTNFGDFLKNPFASNKWEKFENED